MNDIAIREATEGDAADIRSLVTRALLSAGLPSPEPELDHDLIDLSYYMEEGRGMWIAERGDVVVGCAAIDRGEPGIAVLRRLAGGGLSALVQVAVNFAAGQQLAVVETVIPPGLPGTHDALVQAGFSADPGANMLLLRRTLP